MTGAVPMRRRSLLYAHRNSYLAVINFHYKLPSYASFPPFQPLPFYITLVVALMNLCSSFYESLDPG